MDLLDSCVQGTHYTLIGVHSIERTRHTFKGNT